MAKEHIISFKMVVKNEATGKFEKGGKDITKSMNRAGISVSKAGKVMVNALDKAAAATKRAAREQNRMRVHTDGLRRVIGRLRNMILVYVFALRPLIRLIKSSIQAAKEQEIAETKLQLAFKGSGLATKQQVEELEKYAVALQKVTTFGDEEIINAEAMLATFQLTAEQIKKATPRVLDMARGISKLSGRQADLQQIAIAVGKGLTGQVGILSKYGVVISDAAKSSGDFNMILGEMDKNFKDMSIAQMNFTDQSVVMSKTWSDFTQSLGEFITKHPDIIIFMKRISQVFSDWAESISEGTEKVLGERLIKFREEYKNNTDEIIKIKDEFLKSFADAPEGLHDEDRFVKSFNVSELISTSELEKLRERQIELKSLIDNMEKNISSDKAKVRMRKLITELEKWGIKIVDIGTKTSKTLEKSFSNFFFDAMIDDLKTLEEYFAEFGRNVLRILSDTFATSLVKKAFGFLTSIGGGATSVPSPVIRTTHAGGIVGRSSMRSFHTGGVVNANLLEGEGVLNRRGLRDLGTDNLNKINEGRPIDQGAGNAPIVIIHAWDASDIRRNEGAIISIIAKAMSSNNGLRGVIKQYG